MATNGTPEIIEVTLNLTEELQLFLENVHHLKDKSECEDSDRLQDEIAHLKAAYKQDGIDAHGEVVDFSVHRLRKAYLLQYGLPHLLGTFASLNTVASSQTDIAYRYRVWLRYQTGNRLKVCSIGGGPGTDVFALQAHLLWLYNETKRKNDFFPKGYRLPAIRHVTVLDKYQIWEGEYEFLRRSLYLPAAKYMEFDFEKMFAAFEDDQHSWQHSIREADYVTMVKFVSSVMKRNSAIGQVERFQDKLKKLLLLMKHYSLFLYVDVDDGFLGTKVAKTLRDAKFIKFYEGSFTFDISGYDFAGVPPTNRLPLMVQLWCCQNDIYSLFPSFR